MKTRFSTKANGHSMYPLLQDGDIVEYHQVPFESLELNDIVLTYVGNCMVTHRVIYKTDTKCVTRGDNNAQADPPLIRDRVIAKAVRFKRGGTWRAIEEVYFVQSALYLHEIHVLQSQLRKQKIPHVFLKGLLVSLHYEGTIPKRIYADCDILVDRKYYMNIQAIVLRLGFMLQDKSFLALNKKVLADQPEVSYIKTMQGIPIVFDMHFEPVFLLRQFEGMSLLYPERLLMQLKDRLINNSQQTKVKGGSYSLCSLPDQILYLALHIFHHTFTDSVRYRSLDSIIRQASKKQIQMLQNTITTFRLQGYLYPVFYTLKRYFNTPLPNSFLASIQPSFIKKQFGVIITKRVDIFSQANRASERLLRFISIFLLSPEPIIKKLFFFVHPGTISIYFTLTISLLRFLFKKKMN